MSDKQISRLPVRFRSKQVVGLVSLGDLAVGGIDRHTSGAVLQQLSDPSRSQRQGLTIVSGREPIQEKP